MRSSARYATAGGVANRLDTAALHDGYAIPRWQVVPADVAGESLLREFAVTRREDAAAIPGIAPTSLPARQASLQARAEADANRAH